MEEVAGSNPASSTTLRPGDRAGRSDAVLVLRSKKDGHLYKGVTRNVERRLLQHNAGKTRSLRHRVPLESVYVEEFATREEALAREKWSKTPAGGKQLGELLRVAGSPARAGKPSTG